MNSGHVRVAAMRTVLVLGLLGVVWFVISQRAPVRPVNEKLDGIANSDDLQARVSLKDHNGGQVSAPLHAIGIREIRSILNGPLAPLHPKHLAASEPLGKIVLVSQQDEQSVEVHVGLLVDPNEGNPRIWHNPSTEELTRAFARQMDIAPAAAAEAIVLEWEAAIQKAAGQPEPRAGQAPAEDQPKVAPAQP